MEPRNDGHIEQSLIIEISKKLTTLSSAAKKMELVYKKTGTHFLLCEKPKATDHRALDEEGEPYYIDVVTDIPLHTRLSFLEKNYTADLIAVKEKSLKKKFKNISPAKEKAILDAELGALADRRKEFEAKRENREDDIYGAYLIGYSNNKRGLSIPDPETLKELLYKHRGIYTWKEEGWINYFKGVADALYESYLIDQVSPPAVQSEAADILFSITGYNEKLLFLKHTGIFEGLKKQYKHKKSGEPYYAKIAGIIAYIINEKSVRTIAGKIGYLENPERVNANNPYTSVSVPNVIKALDDIGITDDWLLEFSKRYNNKSKD